MSRLLVSSVHAPAGHLRASGELRGGWGGSDDRSELLRCRLRPGGRNAGEAVSAEPAGRPEGGTPRGPFPQRGSGPWQPVGGAVMAVLTTVLDPGSEQFQRDRSAMVSALEELRTLADQVVAAGGEKTVRRHHERGRLLARERVDLLLDEDAPFLELSCYAGAHEPDGQPGGRLITGIGA